MFSNVDPTLFFVLASFPILLIAFFVIWLASGRKEESFGNQILEDAKKEQEKEPEKNKPAYDEAYGRLAIYIDNNIQQSHNIYRLTVVMIIMGFVIVLLGIVVVAFTPSENPFAETWPIIAAGVITEFIAGTILLVYKSVFQQTAGYFQTLERFSSIGMSIQILDDLDDDEGESYKDLQKVKVDTKAEIAKLLLRTSES